MNLWKPDLKRLRPKRKDKHNYYGEVKEIEEPEHRVEYKPNYWNWIYIKIFKPFGSYLDNKLELGIKESAKQVIKSYGWVIVALIVVVIITLIAC